MQPGDLKNTPWDGKQPGAHTFLQLDLCCGLTSQLNVQLKVCWFGDGNIVTIKRHARNSLSKILGEC